MRGCSIIDIPPPPLFDIETMEPIEPPCWIGSCGASRRAQSSGTRGEARMILSMVSGARDAEDAWTQFQDEVLSRCAVR